MMRAGLRSSSRERSGRPTQCRWRLRPRSCSCGCSGSNFTWQHRNHNLLNLKVRPPMLAPRPTPRKRTRRGIVAAEMLLAIPVFMVVVLGMVGLSDLLITEQLLAEASGRGARTAALGGTED